MEDRVETHNLASCEGMNTLQAELVPRDTKDIEHQGTPTREDMVRNRPRRYLDIALFPGGIPRSPLSSRSSVRLAISHLEN